jgi:CubicO group peptidase (beta-lactamase class C family)
MKFAISLTFLLALVFESPAQQVRRAPDFSKAKSMINEYIEKQMVPSVSVAVVYHGKIVWEESFGYADLENKRRATIHTPYYLASVSKTITATAIMKLAEKKLIALDSPVNKYLSGGMVRSPMWDVKGATVRRVMSHTAGLTTFNSWCREDSATCAMNDSRYISRYAVLVSPPGDHFDYSNLGYGILDRVISNTTRTSFPEYLSREIFAPLGMKDSYLATDLRRADRAIRYNSSDKSRFEFGFSHPYSAGASLVYGSVHDLAQFALLHLNDDHLQNKILSKQSINAMQDTIAKAGSEHYGLGWWIRNDFYGYKSVLAQGGTSFSSASIRLLPAEQIAIIILINSGGAKISPLTNEILTALLPEFQGKLANSSSAPQNVPAELQIVPPATKWKGSITTYKGDVPVIFSFNGPAHSHADVGDFLHGDLKHVEVQPNWYSFSIEGDLGLEDTGRGPYNLTFYLNQKGDLLYGSVETSASVHGDTPQLAYWVMLRKVE